jgi:hypothetical protein
MSNQVSHAGLYFTAGQAESTKRDWETDPALSAAMTRLRELGGKEVEREQGDILANAQLYWLDDDHAAGEWAVSRFPALLDRPVRANPLGASCDLAMLLHTAELLRDHRAFTDDMRVNIHQRLEAQVDDLLPRLADGDYVHEAWSGCLRLLAGIVLERENWLNEGVGAFYHAVDHEIRPQGFITRAVEGEFTTNRLFRQVACIKALILMAEAARVSVNLDLWGYQVRGVSVITAAMYPIYYYYTTKKWKWDENLSVEAAQAAFRQHGGWLEIVQYRLAHKDLAVLLEDLRPIFDPSGGGMTTLTHALPAKPKRRGFFG